ncbi:MAG TPA: OB-fold domain-containing protein [Xanthobacteraceae bacterium]|nr:OB-fold domain-containing protein [Xanthobacteraceae bacterium]
MNAPKVLDPIASPEHAPFRDAARAGRFVIPVCRSCGKAHWYPRARCPFCFSGEIDWRDASGQGTVYSCSVTQRASPPHAIAYVTLAEGPSVLTSIVDSDLSRLKIGAAVEVVLTEVEDGMFFPFFRLKRTAG